jgi:acetyl esterase/lipase
LLTHGKADKTVPWQQTRAFAGVLSKAGVHVDLELYDGLSHTDAILEGPMSGSDDLMAQLLRLVREQAEQAARVAREAGSPCGRSVNVLSEDYFLPRVLPVWVVAFARWVNPF